MKHIRASILCIFISVTLICEIPAQSATVSFQSSDELSRNKNSQPITILFIGNSHTYTNDIPAIISRMASYNGDSVYTFMFYPYAQLLNDMIKKNCQTTKVILYMTHGYNYATSWCSTYPDLCTYSGMQEALKQNYVKMSELLNAVVAPAGILWKIIMRRDSSLELYAMDNLHPNINGSYISACTIYATIFHKKLTGSYHPPSISEETAYFIQNAVTEVMLNDNIDWKTIEK